jgi:hypothetical protein
VIQCAKIECDWVLGNSIADQLTWGAPDWAWPAAAIAISLLALVLWSYRSVGGIGPLRFVCGLLKLVAIGLLAVCLLQPLRSGTRPRPQANLLPIVVDNSQSMRIKAGGENQSRHDRVLSLVNPDTDWRVRLARSFDVRDYAFDSRLQKVDDLRSLRADGQSSALTTSLKTLGERFAGRPVAGAVLISDGNLTDAGTSEFDWNSIGFPIYPVIPAVETEITDLRITDVNLRQTDFESAPTTLTVSYQAVGLEDQSLTATLTDADGKLVEQQTLANVNAEPAQITFRFRPTASGVSFYTVSVAIEEGTEVEATVENNRRLIAVDRAAGPYRVLYVAGRPNWEFKFLRRALQSEAEVQLVGLIRIARQEPKFSFRDKGVSETNPLFAGLGESEEETAQQYDEPVIIRLGVREQEELSDGFPKTAAELFAYQGVILDDIESDFFTQDEMEMLRRFVAARGGGLLMLGGTESFSGQDFERSPLGDLSPVYTQDPGRKQAAGEPSAGPFSLSLTREGLLQPWMRLRETESAELQRIESMPPFKTLNRVGRPKPGAVQLATVAAETQQPLPAVVVQRFGNGRTAAILLGDLWRWSMRRGLDESAEGARRPDVPDDPAQAWRQLTRWLVNDVPRRVEIALESKYDESSVSIRTTVRDAEFLPLDNAQVQLTVQPPSGETFVLNSELAEQQPGVYQATCWSQETGGYRVSANVIAADGSVVGTATSGWTAQPAAAELATLQTNRDLLARIAQQTGGELIFENDLDQFAADLPTRKVPVTETWVYPIWHRPWVMIAAMLCLCGEWGLRRWKGLT